MLHLTNAKTQQGSHAAFQPPAAPKSSNDVNHLFSKAVIALQLAF